MDTRSDAGATRDTLERSRLTLQALEPLASARGADAEWHALSARLWRLSTSSARARRDNHLTAALQQLVEDAEHLVDRVLGRSERPPTR